MKIRHKIMVWVTGAGVLTSLLFSLVVFAELREQPLEMMDSQMAAAAASVAEQVAKMPSTSAEPREIVLPLFSRQYWIKVYDPNLRVIYQSDLAKAVDLPLYRDKGSDAYTISTHVPQYRINLHQSNENEAAFRVRAIPKTINGESYLIQIAEPEGELEEETYNLLAAIGFGLIASTVVLAGLSYVLAGRIVKPIAAINRLARDINENTLEKRIPLGRSQDEIHELATRLNHMFDRLQYSFARQKQFLADASHELKSPIAMLRLFFDEATQRPDLPESLYRQLDIQGNNVLRMDRLVRTLLELSILEIKGSLALEPFDLAELARSVAADFEPFMEDAKLRLETEIPGPIEIWGDKDQIRRALINLFDNAVKYNKEDGRIRFTVTEEKSRVHLSLYNTGPGIPAEDLPKVFDQFYRVEKSRSAELGGAGLGLSIVREIVRLHGGEITIDSQPGQSTRIDIFLPKYRQENLPV